MFSERPVHENGHTMQGTLRQVQSDPVKPGLFHPEVVVLFHDDVQYFMRSVKLISSDYHAMLLSHGDRSLDEESENPILTAGHTETHLQNGKNWRIHPF